jgi:ureidoglycolate hydrolase
MDKALLEIRNYNGEGYKPLIDYGTWRVAILRYLDALQPDRINSMERHKETDEVFVLLKGRGVLIIGGNRDQVDRVRPQTMELGDLYNVKRDVWHTILLSRDASVLIVENKDTGEDNTEFDSLRTSHRQMILDIAENQGFGQGS